MEDEKVNIPNVKQKVSSLKAWSNFSKPQLIIFVLAFGLIGYIIFKSFAAAPLLASLEAEQLSLPVGASVVGDTSASGGKAMLFTVNSTSTGSVNLPSASSSLTVIAKGTSCQGSANMTIAVDGNKLMANQAVSSSTWASYTVAASLNAGSHEVSASFNNAYTKTKGKFGNVQCFRSLYLDVYNFYGASVTTTPAPTVNLSASPGNISPGQSSTLTWSSTNATACSASGAWSGSQPTSGSVSTGALNQSSTYTLTCTGAGGSASASAVVTVATASSTDINVLTQYGTTDSAIRSAINAASSQGKGLYFPAATYNYGSKLTFSGIKVHGDGDGTIFKPATKSSMALVLTGNGVELKSVKINCSQCELPSGPPTSARLSTGDSAGVFILPTATNFVVDYVTVDRAGSTGILNWGGSYGSITNNKVLNTLADAIHNTNGANNVEVAYNSVSNVGDDMFAVVSYRSDGKLTHDIKVHDNTGNGQPWGRGATVVGGSNVQINNNDISHTYGAGIYIASENYWSTYGVNNVQINGNTVRYPDQGSIHNANIYIYSDQSSYPVAGVSGSSDNLDRLKPGLYTGTNTSSISVGWFYGN